MKKKIFVILGNQLFNLSFFLKFKKRSYFFFLSEDLGLCTYEKHHKQKILLFLSAMRSFRDELEKNGFEVIYKKIEDDDFEEAYMVKLKKLIKEMNINSVSVFEIEDKPFEKKFLSELKNYKLNYLSSPMFLTSRAEFKSYLSNTKKPFMANFYKLQRKKIIFLIDENDNPTGGKWSFDEENRKKIPKEFDFPKQFKSKETEHTKYLKKIIEVKFKDHVGSTDDFWICTTRQEAWKKFNHFIEKKLIYLVTMKMQLIKEIIFFSILHLAH